MYRCTYMCMHVHVYMCECMCKQCVGVASRLSVTWVQLWHKVIVQVGSLVTMVPYLVWLVGAVCVKRLCYASSCCWTQRHLFSGYRCHPLCPVCQSCPEVGHWSMSEQLSLLVCTHPELWNLLNYRFEIERGCYADLVLLAMAFVSSLAFHGICGDQGITCEMFFNWFWYIPECLPAVVSLCPLAGLIQFCVEDCWRLQLRDGFAAVLSGIVNNLLSYLTALLCLLSAKFVSPVQKFYWRSIECWILYCLLAMHGDWIIGCPTYIGICITTVFDV